VKNPFPHIPRLQKTLGNPPKTKKKNKKTRRGNKRERSTWIKFLGNKTKPTKKREKRKKKKAPKKKTPIKYTTQHNR